MSEMWCSAQYMKIMVGISGRQLIDTESPHIIFYIYTIMILIWSGEGGPLQWLCLIIFCLQFFAPQLIQLSDDLRNLNGSTSSYSQYPFDVEHFPFHWVAACLLVVGAAMWIFMEFCQRRQQQQQQVGEQTNVNGDSNGAATTNTAPYGSATNPVIIEDDHNIENSFGVRGLSARVNTMLQSLSPAHFMLAVGFALPLLMSFPLVWNLLKNKGLMGILFTDPGMVQVSVLAVAAHSVMAIAAYRVLRDVLDSGGVGQYPGNNRQGGRRRRMRKLTVAEIADIGTLSRRSDFLFAQIWIKVYAI